MTIMLVISVIIAIIGWSVINEVNNPSIRIVFKCIMYGIFILLIGPWMIVLMLILEGINISRFFKGLIKEKQKDA